MWTPWPSACAICSPMPEAGLAGLEDGTVEIGWLRLDEVADEHLEPLSPAERERAGRLRAPAARAAFVQTRRALRLALSQYLQMPAEAVPISLSADGKPRLTADIGLPDVRFNLAHTRGLALCAFALGRELGIDVEWRAPGLPWLEMAATAFSPTEHAALAAMPASAHRQGFYAGWTRKEAWLKGLGTGFTAGALAATDVPIDPFVELMAAPLLAPDGAGWSLFDLSIPGGGGDHAAALACEGRPPALSWLDLSAAPSRSSV